MNIQIAHRDGATYPIEVRGLDYFFSNVTRKECNKILVVMNSMSDTKFSFSWKNKKATFTGFWSHGGVEQWDASQVILQLENNQAVGIGMLEMMKKEKLIRKKVKYEGSEFYTSVKDKDSLFGEMERILGTSIDKAA